MGNNFDKELEEEEKVALSDYHEMFFVDELFKDVSKFNDMLDDFVRREKPKNNSIHNKKLNL